MKKWVPTDSVDWLEPDDIEADPVGDLATTQNDLSIFAIENDILAKRAVAAVAAKLSNTKDLGYVIITQETLQSLGLDVEVQNGQTDDDEVNAWHRNIIRLSGNGVVRLAKTLKDEHTFIQFFPDDLAETLKESLKEGHLKLEQIQDKKIKKKIQGTEE